MRMSPFRAAKLQKNFGVEPTNPEVFCSYYSFLTILDISLAFALPFRSQSSSRRAKRPRAPKTIMNYYYIENPPKFPKNSAPSKAKLYPG